MPGFSAIPDSLIPKAGDDVRGWTDVLAQICRFVNAWRNPRVVLTEGRAALTISESNVVLEIPRSTGGDGAADILRPWQPYAAPYAGDGSAPADQARKIMLRPGSVFDGVNLWQPARKNLVITVPPDCTDGYFVWLHAYLNAQGVILSLDYDHGAALPPAIDYTPDPTGAPPVDAYDLLLEITSDADSADVANAVVSRSAPLALKFVVTEDTAGNFFRRAYFEATTPG